MERRKPKIMLCRRSIEKFQPWRERHLKTKNQRTKMVLKMRKDSPRKLNQKKLRISQDRKKR